MYECSGNNRLAISMFVQREWLVCVEVVRVNRYTLLCPPMDPFYVRYVGLDGLSNSLYSEEGRTSG